MPVTAQSTGAFARMGLGARSLTMGGQVADLSGAASPYFNPALAPFQPVEAVELSAGILPFDREFQTVQIGAPLKPRAGVAAGVVHLGVSNIDGRDASGAPTETYSADETAFFIAFGIRMSDRISGGAGLRLYRNDLFRSVESPTSIGVSLGMAARVTDRLSLGLAADDLLARYTWNGAPAGGSTVEDRFPIRLRTGTAYALGTDGRGGHITAEMEMQVQGAESIRPRGVDLIGSQTVERDTTISYTLASVQGRVGGEVWLAQPFAVRAAVDRIGVGSTQEMRPALGFALRQRFNELGIRIDYAATLEPYATGIMHMATLRLEL
ncbi:MAG: PorV/PorQ family protein [Rubricoccaceae bacterium]